MTYNRYNIWRVQNFDGFSITDTKYTRINVEQLTYSESIDFAENYINSIQKIYNINGVDVIAEFYDRLYIINEKDSIKYYYGKDYYNFKNMRKTHCNKLVRSKYFNCFLYGSIVLLYSAILFFPIEMNQEEQMNYYERFIINGDF